jgi:alginate O-acetyltransferase complex protein AlgI
MTFHSLVVFFPVVLVLSGRLFHRRQNLLLLGASYLFYGWVHPWFVAIMLVSTTVDYWAGRLMEDHPGAQEKVPNRQPDRESGYAGFLQVFQLLHR